MAITRIYTMPDSNLLDKGGQMKKKQSLDVEEMIIKAYQEMPYSHYAGVGYALIAIAMALTSWKIDMPDKKSGE